MAVSALSRAFRRLGVSRKEIIHVHYSTQKAEIKSKNIFPSVLQLDKSLPKVFKDDITFYPKFIALNVNIPRTELPLNKIIETPLLPNFQIEDPIKIDNDKCEIDFNKVIEIPTNTNIIEKRAERMIVIRRKKMKKHKKKKWLKKWKFVIRKKEHKKMVRKEKLFQSELQEMVAKAEIFDPKQYVAERIETLKRERLPNKWRGEVLPESMIRQFLKERQERKAANYRRRTYRLKLDDEV